MSYQESFSSAHGEKKPLLGCPYTNYRGDNSTHIPIADGRPPGPPRPPAPGWHQYGGEMMPNPASYPGVPHVWIAPAPPPISYGAVGGISQPPDGKVTPGPGAYFHPAGLLPHPCNAQPPSRGLLPLPESSHIPSHAGAYQQKSLLPDPPNHQAIDACQSTSSSSLTDQRDWQALAGAHRQDDQQHWQQKEPDERFRRREGPEKNRQGEDRDRNNQRCDNRFGTNRDGSDWKRGNSPERRIGRNRDNRSNNRSDGRPERRPDGRTEVRPERRADARLDRPSSERRDRHHSIDREATSQPRGTDSNKQSARDYRNRTQDQRRDYKSRETSVGVSESSGYVSSSSERSRPDRHYRQHIDDPTRRRQPDERRNRSQNCWENRTSRRRSRSPLVHNRIRGSPLGDSSTTHEVLSSADMASQFVKSAADDSESEGLDSSLTPHGIDGPEIEIEHEDPSPSAWIRCSPADLYFQRDYKKNGMLTATKRMQELEDLFEELVNRATTVREKQPKVENEEPNNDDDDDNNSDNLEDLMEKIEQEMEEEEEEGEDGEGVGKSTSLVHSRSQRELARKQNHPERLHKELWFNEPGQVNDGPLCRCSPCSQTSGIRHEIYPGEKPLPKCELEQSNADRLYHYRVTMSPHTNFLTKDPTVIDYDNHEYIFEGFSVMSHYKLENVPTCKVMRFNIEYTIHWYEEVLPENFTVRSLDLFTDFLFHELLELVDLKWTNQVEGCRRFHIMPRFARDLPDNGKELLSMNLVLNYLIKSSKPLVEESKLSSIPKYSSEEWQAEVDRVRGMIVTYPGKRPSAIRIDQLDREDSILDKTQTTYPTIVHFGLRPAQLSYVGDPTYQKKWKEYLKFQHLLANKPKVTSTDRQALTTKEEELLNLATRMSLKREVTSEIDSKGFFRTGIKADICQHGLLLPALLSHFRFHGCLAVLEEKIGYVFENKMLLQLALTHPSYRVNYGTNPDHTRNSMSNCGFRQMEYGDREMRYVNRRKRGVVMLVNIMAQLGKRQEVESPIDHYERLEFLGDAVLEFLSSIHLFFMFPGQGEGALATFRSALVQNQHLSVLADRLRLQDFMLYAHGPDLCYDLYLQHAMANCFEALLAALYLDGGLAEADRVLGQTLFNDNDDLLHIWMNLPRHPLQEDEPNGDRHWIEASPTLKKLTKLEDSLGIEFTHTRLLARAFTMRNVAYNNLTFGHNQRLEFLGDTILQLVVSSYLYKHFPHHHEGHLSLLRSCLVNHRTQAQVCNELGLLDYVINADKYYQHELRLKEKADLLEAFIGALYVDKGVEYCYSFAKVCFFPRLKQFIMNQDWNDPKSQLQQCCLTLRELHGEYPDIPVYKVLECTGPTNTRKYKVGVYFRGERLGTGHGRSIQQAEMNAAACALDENGGMFPQLAYQKSVVERKFSRKGDSPLKDVEANERDISDEGDKSKSMQSENKTSATGRESSVARREDRAGSSTRPDPRASGSARSARGSDATRFSSPRCRSPSRRGSRYSTQSRAPRGGDGEARQRSNRASSSDSRSSLSERGGDTRSPPRPERQARPPSTDRHSKSGDFHKGRYFNPPGGSFRRPDREASAGRNRGRDASRDSNRPPQDREPNNQSWDRRGKRY